MSKGGVTIGKIEVPGWCLEWAIAAVRDLIETELTHGTLGLPEVEEYAREKLCEELYIAVGGRISKGRWCDLLWSSDEYDEAWRGELKDIVLPEWYMQWLRKEFSMRW